MDGLSVRLRAPGGPGQDPGPLPRGPRHPRRVPKGRGDGQRSTVPEEIHGVQRGPGERLQVPGIRHDYGHRRRHHGHRVQPDGGRPGPALAEGLQGEVRQGGRLRPRLLQRGGQRRRGDARRPHGPERHRDPCGPVRRGGVPGAAVPRVPREDGGVHGGRGRVPGVLPRGLEGVRRVLRRPGRRDPVPRVGHGALGRAPLAHPVRLRIRHSREGEGGRGVRRRVRSSGPGPTSGSSTR